jgi:transcriptional regulator with XRE-family HTH domain
MLIGHNIKMYRDLRKITREDMCDRLDLSLATYGKIERNEQDITLERLNEIAKILDVPITKLLENPEKFVFNNAVNYSKVGGYGDYVNNVAPDYLKVITDSLALLNQNMANQNILINLIIELNNKDKKI